MLKLLFKKVILGIALGSTLLNFILLSEKLFAPDYLFLAITDDYIRQSLCAMAVAIVFSVLSIVYYSDHLNIGIKVLIHMGVGLIFYFIIAFYAHWIVLSTDIDLGIIIPTLLSPILVSFVIWYGFYIYSKVEAKKINDKISKMK